MALVEQPQPEGNEKQVEETVPETQVQNGNAEEEEEISMKGPAAPSATQFAAIAKLVKHVSQDSEGGAAPPPPPPEEGVQNGDGEEGVENGDAEEGNETASGENGTSLGSIASAANAAKIIKQKSLEKSQSTESDNIEKAPTGSMTRVINAAKLVKRLTQDSIHVVPEVEPSKEAIPSGLLEEEEKGACNTPVDIDAGEKQDASPQEGAKVPSVAALASALKMAKGYSQDAETKAGDGSAEGEGEATAQEPAENSEEKQNAETEISNAGNAEENEGEVNMKDNDDNDKNNETEKVSENTCIPKNNISQEPTETEPVLENGGAQEPASAAPETTEEIPPAIPPKETVGEKSFQEQSVDPQAIELNEQNDAKDCDENTNETAEKPEAANEKPGGSSVPMTGVITQEIKKQELCPHCVIL